MNEVERIEAVNTVFANPALAAGIGLAMLIVFIVFVYIYGRGQATAKDIRRAERRASKRYMQYECEIEKIKSEWRQVVIDKYAATIDLKIVREELDATRKQLKWEQYKNAQLMKGVIPSEEERDAFIAETDGGAVKSVG